jgi:hypothetical protein
MIVAYREVNGSKDNRKPEKARIKGQVKDKVFIIEVMILPYFATARSNALIVSVRHDFSH